MELNKNNFYRLLFLIILAISYYLGVKNIASFWHFFQDLVEVIRPVIWALVLAFILNVPMKNIEKYCFKAPLWRKVKRPIALILSLCVLLAVISLFIFFVIPNVVKTMAELLAGVPGFVNRIQVHWARLIEENGRVSETLRTLDINWAGLLERSVNWGREVVQSFISNTLVATGVVFSGLTTFVISLILAVYILISKETLQRQMNKVILVLFSDNASMHLYNVLQLANRTFSAYVSGQFFEACLLGFSTYIGMNILSLPFSSLIGVVVGIFAMVPIVGAFISGAIGTLLVLTDTSAKALIFAIFFIVLQQIDANLVYPHVVGKSVRLSALWVLIAISVGGSLAGVLGILISIPVFSVVYTLLSQWVNKRVAQKELKQMPQRWFDRTFNFFTEVNDDLLKKDCPEMVKKNNDSQR